MGQKFTATRNATEMDITKFNFPKLRTVDIAFSTLSTDPLLLKEAKSRGFYNGHTKYNDLATALFFQCGKLNFKPDLDPSFKEKATAYLKALMNSFSPKHEEKEAVAALLLSELVEAQ